MKLITTAILSIITIGALGATACVFSKGLVDSLYSEAKSLKTEDDFMTFASTHKIKVEKALEKNELNEKDINKIVCLEGKLMPVVLVIGLSQLAGITKIEKFDQVAEEFRQGVSECEKSN